MTQFQSPRGTRDILPEDQPYWKFVLATAAQKAATFGFEKIDLPMFEDEKVFIKAVGEATDIVEKELFYVSRASTSNDDDATASRYVLRPEGTASVVRAYLQHGMATWTQPVKLWYTGSLFRYERPQKGRYREYQTMGVELFGDSSPATDALVILLLWQIFEVLGISERIIIDINTLGDKVCRPKIKKALIAYFSQHVNSLCKDCQRRLQTNPLRLLDCKEESCQPIKKGAPQLVDLVDDDCRTHFKAVLEHLDDLGIPYDLNPYLVRGLDYYTKTTFEIREKNDERRQSSLAGGGRYDNLVEVYGGQATPAIGFGLGIDRIVDFLKDNSIPLPTDSRPTVTIVQLGTKARRQAITLVKQITQAGIAVAIAPGKDSLKGQMRLANKTNSQIALIIGQQEANENSVIIKNLADSSQETIPQTKLLDLLKKKLSRD